MLLSIKRFFDWLETKWPPATLRSYDIARMREGERPVFKHWIPKLMNLLLLGK